MTDQNSTTADIQSKVAQTRAQLESTLDSIEDKLNVPKQFGILLDRAKAEYAKDPAPWLAGAAGVVLLIGGLVAVAVAKKG